jgi:hypothetical protein
MTHAGPGNRFFIDGFEDKAGNISYDVYAVNGKGKRLPRPILTDDPMPAIRPTTAGMERLINDLELE